MAKKIFKKEQIIAAYNVLKDAKLGKVETVTDKLRVVDAIRMMRPVVTTHDDAIETARKSLMPEGLEAAQKQLRDSGKPTQIEMMKVSMLQSEYNEALTKYARALLSEDADVKVSSLSKECLDHLIEGNPDWTPEQIMAVIDVLG